MPIRTSSFRSASPRRPSLLAGAAPAGAAPARTAKLSPPVIHESFTPLPCTGAPGTSHHASRWRAAPSSGSSRSDKQDRRAQPGDLRKAVRRRRPAAGSSPVTTPGSRYRHAYCLSASDVFEGGTEARRWSYADCVAARQLRARQGSEGSSSPVSAPRSAARDRPSGRLEVLGSPGQGARRAARRGKGWFRWRASRMSRRRSGPMPRSRPATPRGRWRPSPTTSSGSRRVTARSAGRSTASKPSAALWAKFGREGIHDDAAVLVLRRGARRRPHPHDDRGWRGRHRRRAHVPGREAGQVPERRRHRADGAGLRQ